MYAQTNDCRVSYFRDSPSLEVDAVIERGDGEWIAVEIKLGGEKLIEQGGRPAAAWPPSGRCRPGRHWLCREPHPGWERRPVR